MFKPTQKKIILLLLLFILLLFIIVILSAICKRKNNISQYDQVNQYMASEDYDKAIHILNDLKYEDSEILIIYLEAKILLNNKDYKEAINKLTTIEDFRDSKEQIQWAKYNLAIQYFEDKNYDSARLLFKELNDYKDSKIYLDKIDKEQLIELTETIYKKACNFLDSKNYEEALENFELILDYKDSKEKAEICKRLYLSHPIVGAVQYSLGLTKNGKVLIAGNKKWGKGDVELWENIISIDGYFHYIIGLTQDGIVKVAGKMEDDTKDVNALVSNWENVIDIAAGEQHIVALTNNGKVLSEGYNTKGQRDVTDWENVIDIDAGWNFTVGLTDKGELVFAGDAEKQISDYTNKKDEWKDVIKISASGGEPNDKKRGAGHTVGLTKSRHVVAVGDNDYDQCNVSEWEDIIDIVAGDWYTVGLTGEGKILITGENVPGSKYIDQEKIDAWENIEAIAAGYGQTLVLKNNGYVEAMGFEDKNKISDIIKWGNLNEK